MKKLMLLLLLVTFVLHQLGCMSAPQPQKGRSLNEWGKLSRPKF
ncbi:MAG: hypothetical protein U0930_19320 [Pirellulales bacterium]